MGKIATFAPKAVTGGVVGCVFLSLRKGISRGIFEVFMDANAVCTLAAIVLAETAVTATAAPLPVGLSWEEPAPGLDYGRIYYYVPPKLDLSEKPGLLVFMHGGGAETKDQPAKYLNPTNGWLRPHVDDAPFVVAAATAPHARGDHWRWGHADAEREVVAIVEAVAARMPIDRNRIVLGGQSMGGFGAYQLGPILADRLAGVWAAAGAWHTADFRALRGTPVFLQHGLFDCAPGYSNEPVPRAQYKTGLSFARAADELMTRDGVEHVLSVYPGGHGLAWPAAQESTKRFLAWAAKLRRDPYAPAVTVVTPCGAEKPEFAVRRRMRWLEVTKTVPGTVELDAIDVSDYESANDWAAYEAQTYRLRKKRLAGFRLEAFNRGNNRFEVRAENVTAFRIHLAGAMGDLGRPFVVDAGPLGTRTLTARAVTDEPDYAAVIEFEATPAAEPAAKTVTVRPVATKDVLVNPDMGLVWYAADGSLWKYGATTRPYETLDWLPGLSVIAFRLPWRELAVAGGPVRWDVIDSYARTWVGKGRKFALEITGDDMPEPVRKDLAARYADNPDVAWKDGDRPDLWAPEVCGRTFLPRDWDGKKLMAELEAAHPRYFGIRGFPELCHRNNEELFLSVARRIGYRYELGEIRYPDVVRAGRSFAVETRWTNVGVTNAVKSAILAFSLLDAQGRVAWTCAAADADLRPLASGASRAFASPCTFGCDVTVPASGDPAAEKMRELFYVGDDRRMTTVDPGEYTLAVSVGRADGKPEVALPLANGRDRLYPVGKIAVREPDAR